MAVKCGEKSDIGVPDGDSPSGPSRYRACLIVSLIVLVWNVGASWRYLHFEPLPSLNNPYGKSSLLGPISEQFQPMDCAASLTIGPLNIKQRFLLGRKVDINSAGREEISRLPGISDKVAESIVETRGRIGRFRRPEELMMAKGIKDKKLKKILPFISGFDNN